MTTVYMGAIDFDLSDERVNSFLQVQCKIVSNQLSMLQNAAISGAIVGPRSFNPEIVVLVEARLN